MSRHVKLVIDAHLIAGYEEVELNFYTSYTLLWRDARALG
jgi:hypothetical protein